MTLEVLDAIISIPTCLGPGVGRDDRLAFISYWGIPSTVRFGVSAGGGCSSTCEVVRVGSLLVHPLPPLAKPATADPPVLGHARPAKFLRYRVLYVHPLMVKTPTMSTVVYVLL